jgi:endonuclease YncB( thermonuclease family)
MTFREEPDSPMRLALLVVAMIAGAAPVWGQSAIVGRAAVIDGDTFDIGRVRIRLWGIDAPESRQTCTNADGQLWRCGAAARTALRTLTTGASLQCISQYRDRDGRQVAKCSIGGRDVAGQLVAQGWVLDYPHFSKGAFQASERQARLKRIGVWQGTVTPPWEWRAQQQQGRIAADDVAGRRCRIKGNINAAGQRIAHAPGQRDYATVRIDADRGERWFCTLAAASAAGWRPAVRWARLPACGRGSASGGDRKVEQSIIAPA